MDRSSGKCLQPKAAVRAVVSHRLGCDCSCSVKKETRALPPSRGVFSKMLKARCSVLDGNILQCVMCDLLLVITVKYCNLG